MNVSALHFYLVPALALAVLTGCDRSSESPDYLAKVGDQTLTEADFLAAAKRRSISDHPAAKQALLDELVTEMKLIEFARENALDQQPGYLDEVRKLLISHAREAIVAKPIAPPTEAEIQASYNARQEEFTTPDRLHLAMIHVPSAPNASAEKHQEAEERARDIREQITQGASFGDLAAKHSAHRPSRYRGGDLGYSTPDSFDPSWGPDAPAAILGLSESGALTPVLASPDGCRIFRLMGRQAGGVRPYNQVRNQLASELVRNRQRSAREERLASVTQSIPVTRSKSPLPEIGTSESASPTTLPSNPAGK